MSENRQHASHERAAKRELSLRKCIQSKKKPFRVSDWLEDLEDYRTLLYRISQSKGVLHGYF
ncbi:MAG: hypothetical protein WCK49_09360 [Myxococcaceae bacterium]